MKRILLTGASGFVGRQIHAALHAQGHQVIPWRSLGKDFFLADQRRAALALCQPEIIVHAAWYVEHGKFWDAPENTAWQTASMAFAEEAQKVGVQRFVGLGTCYEYAWPSDGLCDERVTPTAVHTRYDAAKAALRDHLLHLGDSMGWSTAWARLFLLYGPGEGPKRLGPSVARALLRGGLAQCGSGSAVRDFSDVRDVGAGITALALSPVEGCVNIASGIALSIREFVEAIAGFLGASERVRFGARPDPSHEPLRLVAATQRLREEVGFQSALSLEAGIAALCVEQRALLEREALV